jgi:large subunit ribosomal protein L30
MSKVKITLMKGTIKRHPAQRATLTALGLGKRHSTCEKELNDAIRGMIARVQHLVKVENI